MAVHGLLDDGWYFAFNSRRRGAGTCKYGDQSIELSRHITLHTDEHEVRDTILHEIAHALVGTKHGHDDTWVRKAKEIGCNGNRCYDEKNKPSTTNAYRLVAKYVGVCPNGHLVYANRKPKRLKSCAKCCPIFNKDFLFTYLLNNNQ